MTDFKKMTVSELCAPSLAPALDQQSIDNSAWFHSPNNSIYLKFVPQDMTKEDIHATFEFAGPINRIDIVNSAPNKTTGSTYRMAFIHFDYWYSNVDSIDFRQHIISAFPKECRMYSPVAMRELSVTINTRPVPKTNYNIDQLSDMFHRLQEQFTTTVEKQAQEIAELKEEVAHLKKSHTHNQCDYWNLQRDVDGLDKTVKRLNDDMDEFIEWSDGTAGDIQEIREKLDSYNLDALTQEMRAKNVDNQHESHI
jgi:RNA recognition motif-containing protein